MKSLLIIDTPDKCEECPLIYWTISGWACKPTKSIIDEDAKPNWCPLKNLPQTIAYEMTDTQTTKAVELIDNAFKLGWNTCLNVITGETE